jgi:prophage regulatory protein
MPIAKPSTTLPRASVEKVRGVRLLSRQEVCARLGVTYPSIWLWMRQGKFPRSVVISKTKIGWLESEIDAYIASLPRSALKGDAEVAA